MLRRLPLAFTLMTYGVYIIVPTPDELVFHPLMGSFLSRNLNISIQMGVIISAGAYFAIGFAFLASSIIIGGTLVLDELSRRITENVANLSRYISFNLTCRTDLLDGYEAKYNEGFCVLAASPSEHFD